MCRELKDSGIPWIGEIPEGWKVMPHKRVMRKLKEIQEHYNGENILSLTMRGVIVRDLDAGGKMPTTFDGYQKVYPNNLLQCLFDIDVTPRCVGLIKDEGLTSPAYSQFAMYSNGYAPYYDYLLRYMDDRKTLLHLSKNLRSSLTETDFGAVLTCVPSLAEQQRIAEFLDRKCAEVDEMIALQEQIIEELKAYKQSVITEAVTKGLNPAAPMRDSEIPWIKEIPAHWEIHRGKNVLVLEKRPVRDDDDVVTCFRDGEVILRSLRRTEGFTMSDKEIGYQGINEGDIVIHGMDGFAGAMGVSKSTGKGSPVLVVCTPKYDAVPQYIVYYLRALAIMDVFVSLATGIRERSCDLRWNKISELSFIIPSPTEQQAIADYLDEKCANIDSLIQAKQSKIDSLKEYKKSIIYEYVTGKREVE